MVDIQAKAGKAEGFANLDLNGNLQDAEIVLENIAGQALAMDATGFCRPNDCLCRHRNRPNAQ